MSEIKVNNFLDVATVKEFSVKQKKELEEEVQQYFMELNMVFDMKHDQLIPYEQFFTLYDDICDNLNRVLMEVKSI